MKNSEFTKSGQEFENRGPQIEHIVHNHTGGKIKGNHREGFLITDDCKQVFLRISSQRFPSLVITVTTVATVNTVTTVTTARNVTIVSLVGRKVGFIYLLLL